MRIAQVAPLVESVPPRGYGGTERVVAWLTEELVRQGHEVTLFATADSQTSAELVGCAPHALRTKTKELDPTPWHVAMLERVAERAGELDVIHFHTDLLHFPIARRLSTPSVTTLHGRLDLPGYSTAFGAYRDIALVSISDSQRQPLPDARWVGTVHHGLPPDAEVAGEGRGNYFLFLGRLSRDKRPDLAIEIARRAGVVLKIAAKFDPENAEYFDREVRPRLGEPGIEMLGEVDERAKRPLLADARALLFPIDWPEPFGLVMIEAMACGTPVVAYARGSVPEIIDEGVTGFVVDDLDAAVDAAKRAGDLDRARIREVARARFSSSVMAARYASIYERLVVGRRARAA